MLKKEAIERLTKYRMAVEQALEARRAWAEKLDGDDNPQVEELRWENQVRAETYEAVLEMMMGDYVSIRLDGIGPSDI
jgi:hypothetical protein